MKLDGRPRGGFSVEDILDLSSNKTELRENERNISADDRLSAGSNQISDWGKTVSCGERITCFLCFYVLI